MNRIRKNSTSKGRVGELFASDLLKVNGYKIICNNFRCPFGEIDIIAKKDNELYFCEVKTRWSLMYGQPQESITKNKLEKIKRTIDYFIYSKNLCINKLHILVVSQIIISEDIISQKIINVD